MPPSTRTRFGVEANDSSYSSSATSAHPGEPARDDLGERREVVLPLGALDPELPVVRLLRRRVLEDDHRADRRCLLDVRDVVALDPQRQALEVERLAELLERLDPAQPRLLRRGAFGLEGKPCVLGRQLLEPALLASLGGANLDPGAAPLGEEVGQWSGVPHVARHHDLRRHARRGAVVLENEGLEDRRRVLPLDVLEVEAVAVDQLPVPQREDLDDGAVVHVCDADHVDRPDGRLVGTLPLGEVAHREEPVSEAGGLLEALVVGRTLHPLLELAHDRARVAGEELDHVVDHLPVVLLRHVPHARGQAALDVVIEAGDA